MTFSRLLNPNDCAFYDRYYQVTIGYFRSIDFVVCADYEQNALDIVIDWAQEQGNGGWFFDDMPPENHSDYISGGNNGRYMTFECQELMIREIDVKAVYIEETKQ